MTANSPPFALQAGSHSAQLFRQALSTLLGSAGGIVDTGDYLVTQNGVANMSVNVAGGVPGGRIWIPGTTSTGPQGLYYGYNDGTVNLAVAASDPTNPRIDRVVAQVQDAAYSGATNSFQLAVVTGTPAGSPVAPAAPASSLSLATVSVAALATTVVTGNITDTRVQASVSGLPYRFLTGSGRGGKSIIAATEVRTNTAYGLMPTPDRVSGIVLPTDGLIFIAYQATWQQSVASSASAGIFIGANQLLMANPGAASPIAASEGTLSSFAATFAPLSTSWSGLTSFLPSGTSYLGDATTGQVISVAASNGGACAVFAAAGTYDISVQFKSTSGSVTAKGRKLWVWTNNF